ncbi:hypothetical protein KO361_02550 [Candidatus Woesearchaeota archaeon]|nr:hypothetical protein [Candidatus Woesearchaeota archaeon]
MSVSNKTLAVMLLAAIVVSLGGTFVSLSKLGAISMTGYQAFNDTDSGTVQLTIEELISITIEDQRNINFGTCDFGAGATNIVINSEYTLNTSLCNGISEATPIAVRNDGNLPAKVEFNVSKVGTDFSGDFLDTGEGGSSLRYKIINNGLLGNQAGCALNLGNTSGTSSMASYAIFENTSLHNVCGNLTTGAAGSGANSVLAHFEIKIPDAASTGDTVSVTFYAMETD